MFHKTKRPTNNKAINSSTTTNSFNMSQQKVYKDNLVHRIGGPMDFEMTIIDLCDRLMNDSILMQHFRRLLGKTTLNQFQTELLDFAFLDQSALENNHIDLRSIKLRLQRNIAACGLTTEHFGIIKNHFVESLRHSWCNADVIEAASKHVESISYMFGGDFVETLLRKKQSMVDAVGRGTLWAACIPGHWALQLLPDNDTECKNEVFILIPNAIVTHSNHQLIYAVCGILATLSISSTIKAAKVRTN